MRKGISEERAIVALQMHVKAVEAALQSLSVSIEDLEDKVLGIANAKPDCEINKQPDTKDLDWRYSYLRPITI
ncbi:hypothetical protein IB024_01315 [Brucella sp. 6810]|uniref:hypothetical protein n=1 Tax=Brucella sp. 6810 TaxID=2769351 RepID=UPI00165B47ED|nr:hypothetical protein [Brucella sp. 6810]QNQ62428.1 hypothetical protein IB024_01315 [Brucella sp. 6810]